MVLHNPNNWHWVNKDVSTWAREYLDKELIGSSVDSDGVTAEVSKILSMEGDVDVSQRKGKVITLFDVRLQMEYKGKTKTGEEVSGTITVPEVAHDTEEDEYVFEIEIYTETSDKVPVKDLIRKSLLPILRSKLTTLGPALIKEHAKDLQHAKDADPAAFAKSKSNSNTTFGGGTRQADGPNQPASLTDTTNSNNTGSKVNTTTVTTTDEFRTTAQELYSTFTDPQRIAAFTRAPPQMPSGAIKGGEFTLFGGNVSGSYVELVEPSKIVQSWRLAQWPAGHHSRLEIEFDQNDVDSVTVMRVTWKGVPVGQEEVTRRNWGEYYVRSMKMTFGFGTIL